MSLLLVPGLPLLGALLLLGLQRWMGRWRAGALASLAVAASGVLTVLLAGTGARVSVPWFSMGALDVRMGLALDGLSLAWALVVTGVGSLIHLYSVAYMDAPRDRERVWRFMALLNLFVAMMLVLVLADNLVLLYLGWEGVGVSSWLLIGFWHEEDANASAGRKAFLFNRVGDVLFMAAMGWLFAEGGSRALVLGGDLPPLSPAAALGIPLLLLGAASAKSAQIPLLGWLPDAMAGPTPVSALIHAATMVTAGVYLVCRLHPLFSLDPRVWLVVAALGASTALWGAVVATGQVDIKRVLAWSTISQLGFMFLALGSGALEAGVFHFVTHAFFKALLFLGAGAILHALHHEQDLRRMGGLARHLPLVAGTMGLGWLAILGFPGTSGFFSKDAILVGAFGAWPVLGAMGLGAAWLTAFYMSRLVFLAFTGTFRGEHPPGAPTPWPMAVALCTLALLSAAGGLLADPLRGLLEGTLPLAHDTGHGLAVPVLATTGSAVAAWLAWRTCRDPARTLWSPPLDRVSGALRRGTGALSRWSDRVLEPWIRALFLGVARWLQSAGSLLDGSTRDGQVQDWALVVAFGAALLVLLFAVT